MLEVKAENTLASLEKIKAEIKARLENMVGSFAEQVALAASSETPIGDAESIQTNKKYRNYYEMRQKYIGIPSAVGYHKGAWQYLSDGETLVFKPVINSGLDAAEKVRLDAKEYNLGESFSIAAIGPAYGLFVENPEHFSIDGDYIKNIENRIVGAYKVDLQQAYKADY